MNLLRLSFWLFLSIVLQGELFSQQYERIVSLAPSLTKNLYFLGAENLLVGCTSYCVIDPEENKTVVASAIQVNLESVVSLNPDLVLVHTITNPETIESLKNLGLRVETFETPKDYKAICDQFIHLGKLLGREADARALIHQESSKVDSLRNNFKLSPGTQIFFQIGTNPIFTVLPNTFMNDFILFLGGENIAHNLTRGTMTREGVLARNPDIIIVVTMGVMGEQEKDNWLQYTHLSAAENKQVFIVDADLACSPTPHTFTKTLAILIEQLNTSHP